jgi:hypothetical protein
MNWFGFIIALFVLDIVPVWFIPIMPLGFFTKVLLTVFLGGVIFFAVNYGGWKRGFVSGRRR